MLNAFLERLKQGYRTIPFPSKEPSLPERFLGAPKLSKSKCVKNCRLCSQICPVGAIKTGDEFSLNMGKCLFCGECAAACRNNAIVFTNEFRLAARNRCDLIIQAEKERLVSLLDEKVHSLFGRSLKLRQVSAGGCNACEADTNVLGTIVFDLGKFGIQFVASPRHADGLLITGPVTKNMKLALEKTYQAVPSPKITMAVGACAISGGPYFDHQEVYHGADSTIPINLYIPGCPPHPLTILHGLLGLLGKL